MAVVSRWHSEHRRGLGSGDQTDRLVRGKVTASAVKPPQVDDDALATAGVRGQGAVQESRTSATPTMRLLYRLHWTRCSAAA